VSQARAKYVQLTLRRHKLPSELVQRIVLYLEYFHANRDNLLYREARSRRDRAEIAPRSRRDARVRATVSVQISSAYISAGDARAA